MRAFILVSIISFSALVSAYIPNLEMIAERLASNSGRGLYLIDQEVVIHAEPRSYVLHEQWLVENENLLRLRVRGLKDLEGQLDMTYTYNYNRRYTINEDGKKVSSALSTYFIEPLFHFRKTNFFTNKLAVIDAAPRGVLNNLTKESTKHSLNSYLRLARQGGVANYFIGKTSTASGEKFPGAWIEQDQFLLRKLRFADNTEVVAKDFSRNTRGLKFPKVRTISWGENSASISVRKVAGASSASKGRIRHASLNPEKEKHLVRTLPDIAIIKEFYGRFR